MNIYSIPMLISCILCAFLSVVTWLLRRRENINRVFSFFTLALAIDSFAYFMWFQFGSIEDIEKWLRIVFTIGFLVPLGLILFFIAFTGYDKKLDAKVLGIKVRHFRYFSLIYIFVITLLSPITDLIIRIPEHPQHISDVDFGPIGIIIPALFSVLFFYIFVMAYKSYKETLHKPDKRFIVLLAAGTAVWLTIGYGVSLIFPFSSEIWHAASYLGTGLMAVFYFVAIINHQSDKVHDLNINLERKVENRTAELSQKNIELEDTLGKLKQMQKQIIVQEKMATLGQLVAGLTHEINTPISAIRSMNDTRSKAAAKLRTAVENIAPDTANENDDIEKAMRIISNADNLIDRGTERLSEIIRNLKNFARLDEAEATVTDIHEGLDSVLALISNDLLADIEVVREYGDIKPILCHARKMNQVFFNLIKNACQAIDGEGRITITTGMENNMVHVEIRDNGRGIEQERLKSIFDPNFITKESVVRASLGLSICYQIIQEHRGEINVESIVGEGSVVTVSIPAAFKGE